MFCCGVVLLPVALVVVVQLFCCRLSLGCAVVLLSLVVGLCSCFLLLVCSCFVVACRLGGVACVVACRRGVWCWGDVVWCGVGVVLGVVWCGVGTNELRNWKPCKQ